MTSRPTSVPVCRHCGYGKSTHQGNGLHCIDRAERYAEKSNGPEGPLATTTRGEIVSAFPHRRSLDGELSSPPDVDGTTNSVGHGPQVAHATVARSSCWSFVTDLHLKPPTRGTLTTTVSHMGRLESR